MAEHTRYMAVYRGTDALEVDQLEQQLREAGIPLHVFGTRHAAAIGVGDCGMEMRLEVPVELAERATRLIAEFLWPEGGSAEEGIPDELRELPGAAPAPARLAGRGWLAPLSAVVLVVVGAVLVRSCVGS